MITAYVRDTLGTRDNIFQTELILEYCRKNNMEVDDFVKIKCLSINSKNSHRLDDFQGLERGDTLISSELSSLGLGLATLIELLKLFDKRGIRAIFIKNNLDIDPTNKDNPVSNSFMKNILAIQEMQKKVRSDAIKDLYNQRIAEGKPWGNPVSRPRGSKLDKYRDIMLKYKPIGRKGGFSYRSIAKILDIEVGMKVTQETVSKWYRNEEKKKKKR